MKSRLLRVVGGAAVGLAMLSPVGNPAGASDILPPDAERVFAGPPVDVVVVPGAVWLRGLPMTGSLRVPTPGGVSAGTFTGLEWQLVSQSNPASIIFYSERDYHFDDVGDLGDCQSTVIGFQPAEFDATASFTETLRCTNGLQLHLEVTDVEPIRVEGFLAGWRQAVTVITAE